MTNYFCIFVTGHIRGTGQEFWEALIFYVSLSAYVTKIALSADSTCVLVGLILKVKSPIISGMNTQTHTQVTIGEDESGPGFLPRQLSRAMVAGEEALSL